MNERKHRLISELRDREYRETYAEQHVNSMLAAQISTIREQRGLTQAKLAEAIHKQQPAISRIENVNYARWNVGTLRQVANALGCWLNIRFESWGHLVDEADSYTAESLRLNLIGDDPVFFGSEAQGYVTEPVRWVQAELLPWLTERADSKQLRQWLTGVDMPPVGDAEPPFVWLARAVEVEPADSKYRGLLVARVLQLWSEMERHSDQSSEAIDLYVGIFNILATFPSEEAWHRLQKVHGAGPDALKLLPVECHSAFLSALIHNQIDRSLEAEWMTTIKSGSHPWLPANEFDAFEGLKQMTDTPRLDAIAKGLQAMYSNRYTALELEELLVELMQGLRLAFRDPALLGDVLFGWGQDYCWYEPIVAAWAKVFGQNQHDRQALVNGVHESQKPVITNILERFIEDPGAAIEGGEASQSLSARRIHGPTSLRQPRKVTTSNLSGS